jgi:hypothetical protein
MATINEITTGEQAVTSSGAVTGTLDTSGIAETSDFTLKIRIRGLAAGDTANFSFQDTQNSSEFSDAIDVATVNIAGQGTAPEGVTYSFRKYQVPTMRTGATHCQLRVNCLSISGGTATVLAWLED